MCYSQALCCVAPDPCLGGGCGLGMVWDSERFMTIHIFYVFRQQISMLIAMEEIMLLHDIKAALNVKTSCAVNSHISIVFSWAAKKCFCWGSSSPSLDYWIIISYQRDIGGNQKSSSKCSVTWQQIYEEKRCHYKEVKKKERSYSLGRKEDLKKVQEIIDQPAL